MEYSLVKILLGEIAASPATADIEELEGAASWLRSHVVVYGHDKGPRREVRNPQFADAAREIGELRRLLASHDLEGATESAKRALSLLA